MCLFFRSKLDVNKAEPLGALGRTLAPSRRARLRSDVAVAVLRGGRATASAALRATLASSLRGKLEAATRFSATR